MKNGKVHVTISIDGTQEINDNQRFFSDNTGTYNRIIKNIETMQKNGINVQALECTYMLENREKISRQEIAQYLYTVTGVKNIIMSVDINQCLNIFNYSDYEILKLINWGIGNIMNLDFAYHSEIMDPIYAFFNNKISEYLCGAGCSSLLIGTNGKIYPCQLMIDENYEVGNINNWEITRVQYKKIKRMLESYKKSKIFCGKCIAQYWCKKCIATRMSGEKYLFDQVECSYFRNVTEKCLEALAELAQKNQLELFNQKCLEILR